MFEMHDIIEGWLLDSTEETLSPWKAKLLRSHLKNCGRCRAFALELVEFSHDMETVPRKERLKAEEASLLHAQVMAALQREKAAQRLLPPTKLQLRTYFGVSPIFAKAMAVIAIVIGLEILLQGPLKQDQNFSVAAAPKQRSLAAALPSPTSTPSAKQAPIPQLTPAP